MRKKMQERRVSFIQWLPTNSRRYAETLVTVPSAGVWGRLISLTSSWCVREIWVNTNHSRMIYIWDRGQCTTRTLTFTSSMTWGKLVSLSGSQFSHLWNGYMSITRLKIAMEIKCDIPCKVLRTVLGAEWAVHKLLLERCWNMHMFQHVFWEHTENSI